jgi:hypothetical protein
VIEYDGTHYTKKIIREGYRLPVSINLGAIDDFELTIDPADGYKTDGTLVNADPNGDNAIRCTLQGTTTRARYNNG